MLIRSNDDDDDGGGVGACLCRQDSVGDSKMCRFFLLLSLQRPPSDDCGHTVDFFFISSNVQYGNAKSMAGGKKNRKMCFDISRNVVTRW